MEPLENGKEVRRVFLDISKAFDRVWHKGLLYKLKCLGIKEPLLSWFHSYLSHRQQRVVIDGQNSSWVYINAGIPQGSIFRTIVIFNNKINNNLLSNCFLYADDTSLFDVVDDPVISAEKINNLNFINQWCNQWLMNMNPSKCESITFSAKQMSQSHP